MARKKSCGVVDFEELFGCSFNLNKTEIQILKYMIKKQKRCEISEVSKKLGKERSTLQRRFKNLVDKELIDKRQVNLDTGGYMFVYFAKEKEYYLDLAKKILDGSWNRIKEEIE